MISKPMCNNNFYARLATKFRVWAKFSWFV